MLFWSFQPCWEALQGSCALFFNYGTKLRLFSEICKHLWIFFQLFQKFFSSVTVTVVTVVFGTIQNSKNSFIFIYYINIRFLLTFSPIVFWTVTTVTVTHFVLDSVFFCAFIWWCGRIVVTLRRKLKKGRTCRTKKEKQRWLRTEPSIRESLQEAHLWDGPGHTREPSS